MNYPRKKRTPVLEITLSILAIVLLLCVTMIYRAIGENHQPVPDSAASNTLSVGSAAAAAAAAANAAANEETNKAKSASQ